MAYEHLRKEIAKLGESVPGGYKTFDRDGNVVIDSQLPAREWYVGATELFRSPGRKAEKAKLLAQMENSEGADNQGGRLYEFVAAVYCGSLEKGR